MKKETRLALTSRQLVVLGNNIRRVRENKGLSQLQLAQKAFKTDVSHCGISRLERAVTPVPLKSRIAAVAKALRVPMVQLLPA